ncbi:MAG: hypothetical protein HUU55_10005 [Myxococcales bacterium]|nr:hypothetical protein [Myxococcales bacterium]
MRVSFATIITLLIRMASDISAAPLDMPDWEPELRVVMTPYSNLWFLVGGDGFAHMDQRDDELHFSAVGVEVGMVADSRVRFALGTTFLFPHDVPLGFSLHDERALGVRGSVVVEWILPWADGRWEALVGSTLGLTWWWMEDQYDGIGYHGYAYVGIVRQLIDGFYAGGRFCSGIDSVVQSDPSSRATSEVFLWTLIQFDLVLAFRF